MLYYPAAPSALTGNVMNPAMSFGKRPGFGYYFASLESEFFADATITVTDGVASTTVTATDYTWPVAVGGPGAAAGKIGYVGGFAVITVSSVNYRWAVLPTGAGSVALAVTNGIATITIGPDDIEWAVEELP